MRSRLDQSGIWESDWTARCSSLVPSTSRLPFYCLVLCFFPHYLGRKNESLNQTPNNKKLHPNSIRHDRILQIKILLKVLLCSAVYRFFFFFCFLLNIFLPLFSFPIAEAVFRFRLFKISLSGKNHCEFWTFCLLFIFWLDC